jgi:hypothetical protein
METMSTPPVDPVEPGYLTTEFWASQATAGLTIAFALGTDFGLFALNGTQRADITAAAVFVVGIVEAAYAVGRSIRKAAGK